MSDEVRRLRWDALYQSLIDWQQIAMQMCGDEDALPLVSALGQARIEAELVAPPGWTTTRLGLMPMVGETP